MPGTELIPEIVKVTTTMIPALRTVPILRGLVVPLSQVGQMNETKALEELQSNFEKKKRTRKRLRDKFNSKVIKIKDAMQCVEDSLSDGKIALAFGKALLSTITAGGSQDMIDLIYTPIQDCMTKKALQQKNKRRGGLYSKKKPQPYSEKIRVRKGKLHPFLP